MKPVVGFTAAIAEGVVVVEIEAASTVGQLAAGVGDRITYALSPQAAIDLGRALLERGELAAREGPIN